MHFDKQKIYLLLEKFNPLFEGYKIECKVSFINNSEDVQYRTYNSRNPILNCIERSIAKKKEERKYHYQKNRYKLLVLSFKPLKSNSKSKKGNRITYREYAFILEKTERAHLGLKAEYHLADETVALDKIEKRLQKTFSQLETKPVEKVCNESIADLLRYLFSKKYLYKKAILGKSRTFWDIALSVLTVLIFFLIVFIVNNLL